ncbi:fungal-specific transcription factor domain-containing protein [Suillus subalutaceus]|uniref:fungal-specific transcription factor domain-containing protein n=1 Tax=Suillus subalutaceus TaxID=48586 RepID=UPI001B874DFC|nr:fungal-specific transcription factor domain-containing protein [Suillus subalutaceus]KAG1843609.1 fungal-specific transcription factor domain-containing protein [Suillus subalutaceus]
MQGTSEFVDEQSRAASKAPIVRNPRACTVCRAAKMKCVGADDGLKSCQRCKRTGVECVFEKHRRGRKPGSKLSEASKMLRRLEKGLNTAKLKQSDSSLSTVFPADPRTPQTENTQFGGLQSSDAYGSADGYAASSVSSRTVDPEEEEDGERSDEKFPAKLIRRENSFFRTILNPEHKSPMLHVPRNPYLPQSLRPAPLPIGYNDPITAGLINENKAKILFDAIFLRLNPFINLFDPALHSVAYVRSKCPLLFTTLIMAGCKFFEPSLYKECLKLANDLAVRAFAEGWKRVEVIQAFACLTYWREQEDNRTWMYIGYACRMAVELGLNRYHAKPPAHETDFQLRERRNRERTYLVLFVHDRSLSMQTGRHWMLPEDDFIRHSETWHEQGGSPIRCEDVIVSAFAQLRRIATEATDMFHTNRSLSDGGNSQVNIDMVLKNCNGKLALWTTTWDHEMRKANGESFHFSFTNLFCLYSSLFLNSFGVQSSVPPANRTNSHVRALSACFENALSVLGIASKDFREFGVLRYGQETTSVMTAYSAIFLLKLLRSSNTHTDLQSELPEGAAHQIHTAITKTADAYQEASHLSPTSTSAAYHARFLWSLVRNDIERARQNAQKDIPIDPNIQSSYITSVPCAPEQFACPSPLSMPYSTYPTQHPDMNGQSAPCGGSNYTDALGRASGSYGPPSQMSGYNIGHVSETDFHYYRSMLVELGFGENGTTVPANDGFRNIAYGDTSTSYSQHPYVHIAPMGQNGFGTS